MIVLELIFSVTLFSALSLATIVLGYIAIKDKDKRLWLYVFATLFLAILTHFLVMNAWSLNFNYTYCEAIIIGKCPRGEGRGLKVQYTYKGEVCQRCFLTDNYSYEYLAKKQVFKVRVPAYSPITGARIEWE